MPIHDWTRVLAGTFHDFHLAWIAELRRVLNGGLLPSGYYAQAEQVAARATTRMVPDVLTLEMPDDFADDLADDSAGDGAVAVGGDDGGSVALATATPRLQVRDTIPEAASLATRQRRIAIRGASGDRAVAFLEIVSPGNKDGWGPVEQFVEKAVATLEAGLHLQVLDLHPPGPADPGGMHACLWRRLGGTYDPPPGRPLTAAAYVASRHFDCYVEPTAVGEALVDVPLFLTPERYVNVPLEPTYLAAYEGVPRRWKRVIER